MYIGKLFEQYDVNFPLEDQRNLQIIIGENGTGKTQTLIKIKEYFESKNEKVLYFSSNRTLTITHDEAINCETMLCLLNNQSPFKKYNINLDFLKCDFKYQYENYISSGFMQIVNFYCNIIKSGEDSIVLIDSPERSLHIAIGRDFLNDLLNFCKIKKLIVITHNPEIIADNWDFIVEIKQCVSLY